MQLSQPDPSVKPKPIPGLEIRPIGPGDDIEAELDLRRRAFGPIPAAGEHQWAAELQAIADAGQTFGVFAGKRLVASARYLVMRQWWHGRSMPMAGVAGVKVAPEERGLGIGGALMTRLLAELAELGYRVSTLFPSTFPVYRALGWEVGGSRYEARFPASALTSLVLPDRELGPADAGDMADAALRRAGAADAALRRAGAADAVDVIETIGRAHEANGDNGPNTREPAEVARWLDDVDQFGYLAEDGFLAYRWADGHRELQVDYVAAASAATARTFWQILASHASLARTVHACLAPDDPISWLTKEPAVVTTRAEDWMLRVIHPPGAVAARGYPAAASVTVGLELTDQALPANSGRWLLEIGAGAGQLTPAGQRAGGKALREGGKALRLGARGFAALFAGVPVGTLRRAGLVADGDPAADGALDCAFGGPAFMNDDF